MNAFVANLFIDLLKFLSIILQLLEAVVIVSVVLSWLVAFGVLNTRNRGVYQFVALLDDVSGRLLYPIRRFVPPIAGLDLSPLIFLFLCMLVQKYLIGFLMITLLQLAS